MPQQPTTPPDRPPGDFSSLELPPSPTFESIKTRENGHFKARENENPSVTLVENATPNGLVQEHERP